MAPGRGRQHDSWESGPVTQLLGGGETIAVEVGTSAAMVSPPFAL